jgi:hypothetical protein
MKVEQTSELINVAESRINLAEFLFFRGKLYGVNCAAVNCAQESVKIS